MSTKGQKYDTVRKRISFRGLEAIRKELGKNRTDFVKLIGISIWTLYEIKSKGTTGYKNGNKILSFIQSDEISGDNKTKKRGQ